MDKFGRISTSTDSHPQLHGDPWFGGSQWRKKQQLGDQSSKNQKEVTEKDHRAQ